MHQLLLSLLVGLLFPICLSQADMNMPSSPQTPLNPSLPIHNLSPNANQPLTNTLQLAPIVVKEDPVKNSKFNKRKNESSRYSAFLSYASSEEYTIKKRVVLVKASTTRHKRAFMFVFLMNKPTDKQTPEEKISSRKRLHILWTGSRKKLKEQKIIKDEYPMDISIDNYAEGYAPKEWNLVLPNKKPREVWVSLLWTF